MQFNNENIKVHFSTKNYTIVGYKSLYLQIYFHILNFLIEAICDTIPKHSQTKRVLSINNYVKKHTNELVFKTSATNLEAKHIEALFHFHSSKHNLYAPYLLAHKYLNAELKASKEQFKHEGKSHTGLILSLRLPK